MAKKQKVAVKFGAAPPERRSYPWGDIAEALRGRPGEWGMVAEDVVESTAASINAGRVTALRPELGFRARYVGGYQEDGRRMARELLVIYDPELDTTRVSAKNGRKK